MNVSRGRRDHRGSVSAELALVTPLLLLLLVFVVMLGRLAEGRLQVDDAARPGRPGGHNGGRRRQRLLGGPASRPRPDWPPNGVTCSTLTVATDTSDFVPGGVVRVAVTCTVSMAGLSLLAPAGIGDPTGQRREPVDEYRSVGP